jgi:Domain of unknown function (DUF4266)
MAPGAMMSKMRWRSIASVLLLGGLLAGGLLLAGCSPIEPWVKPYEREHLADPIMSFDRNPISSGYLDHVFEVREGARGATGSVGGGCGCN